MGSGVRVGTGPTEGGTARGLAPGHEHGARATGGHDRDRASADTFWAVSGRLDACVTQNRGQHDARLDQSECGPKAASASAAEGYPGVGGYPRVEETFWPEGMRVVVEVRPSVGQCDVRDHHRAFGNGQAGQLEILAGKPPGD